MTFYHFNLIMKTYRLFILILLCLSIKATAQTITDGLMMPKKTFCTGFMYGHDKWTDYWQGETKRDNGNIGHITTQSVTWMGTYGVSSKVNIIAMLPYIKTKSSAGTLRGMEGIQDLTIAGKYNFFKIGGDSSSNSLKAFAGLAFSTPLTDYTPDFLPLSLGASSTNLSWRVTLNGALKNGLYLNVSSAYTWRSNVTLDRSTYYTGDRLYYTNEVHMPNVFDVFVTLGYHKQNVQVEASYTQQNTLGGDDIRRQDMPFVSNRMNFSKVGGLVMYYLPWPKNLAARGVVNYTVAGRNVGQSTTLMAGLMYTFYFTKNK
jgi:hypothetical protein